MFNTIIIYTVLWIIYLIIAKLVYSIISQEYRKRYIIFVILSGLLLKPIVSMAIVILFYILRKIPTKITIFVLILISAGTMGFRVIKGYYPIPYSTRKLYYAIRNDINKIEPIMVDEDFPFWKQGYVAEKGISSPYSLNHSLLLSLQESTIPPSNMSKCRIQTSIYRKQKLIFQKQTEISKDICQNSQEQHIDIKYISLAYIPFPLDEKSYKNLSIKVAIIESDENFEKYFEHGRLYLYPDLSLD